MMAADTEPGRVEGPKSDSQISLFVELKPQLSVAQVILGVKRNRYVTKIICTSIAS